MEGAVRRAASIALLWLFILSGVSTVRAREQATVLNVVHVLVKTNTVRVRVLQSRQVEVRLKDPGGRLRARAERFVTATGTQDIGLYKGTGSPAIIRPGDRVIVTADGEEPVIIEAVFLDVRPVNGTNEIFLDGPPDTELHLQIETPGEILPRQYAVRTDETGSAKFEGVELSPGVHGLVAYDVASYRAVIASFQVPMISAKVGTDWVEGITWANREVILSIDNADGQTKAETRVLADGEGYFLTHLAEEFANLCLQPGNSVRLAWEDQELALTTTALSIRADPDLDQITGQALPGAELTVTVYDRAAGRRYWYETTAGQDGQYQLNLRGRVDVKPNDEGGVIYETEKGQLVAQFRVPLVKLNIDSAQVSGRPTAIQQYRGYRYERRLRC